ncbi:MAG: thiamine diphosphokinase [Anaerolineae bacterium]
MRAIIVAAGDSPGDEEWARWMQRGDLIVAADGGAARILSQGLVPHIVIGDMDSLPDSARSKLDDGVEIVEHPRAKDETDLELALTYAAQRGVQEIVVLGALGGRLDHTLSNVLLLALPKLESITVRIVQGAEEAILVRGGEEISLQGSKGDVVSLLPWGGDARGVTTDGLAWPLERVTLHFAFSRGVSNVMTGPEARIGVEGGYLLVIHGPSPED